MGYGGLLFFSECIEKLTGHIMRQFFHMVRLGCRMLGVPFFSSCGIGLISRLAQRNTWTQHPFYMGMSNTCCISRRNALILRGELRRSSVSYSRSFYGLLPLSFSDFGVS
jgi:hypothetical protein